MRVQQLRERAAGRRPGISDEELELSGTMQRARDGKAFPVTELTRDPGLKHPSDPPLY
jgi:hypothetical protein